MTKYFYRCRIQEWGYWNKSIVSEALNSFKVLRSTVQRSASRVQRPTLVSRVQEFRYTYPTEKIKQKKKNGKEKKFRWNVNVEKTAADCGQK